MFRVPGQRCVLTSSASEGELREQEKGQSPSDPISSLRAGFLKNIGHEIRTPLNGVLGLASLLKSTHLDATQRRYVEAIEKSSDALMGVLSDLLEYAYLEAGAVELQIAPFQIDQLAQSAIATVRSGADAKGLELRVEVSENVACSRSGDCTRILQVLSHLLNNAVKFTQGGSVTLSIETMRHEDQGSLRFKVSDTGIGMSDGDLSAVLEGVSSLHSSESQRSGAGVGLLISVKLARMMGGRIVGKSVIGAGSEFSLELPLPSVSAHSTSALPTNTNPLTGLHILVVGDGALGIESIGSILRSYGVVVESAALGRPAISLAAEGRFDVICVDLRLPIMDGIQTTRAIRDLDGSMQRVPIIAICEEMTELDAWACRQSGFNECIRKPFEHGLAVETLLKWVPNRGRTSLNLGRPA